MRASFTIAASVALLCGGISCNSPSGPVVTPPAWHPLPNAPTATIRKHDDLFFVTPSVGWLATRTGGIYKTTDAGDSWNKQYAGAQYFRSIGFIDSLRGWAGNLYGDSGDVVVGTVNGGLNWGVVQNIPAPRPPGLCGLFVVDSTTIYGSGRIQGPAYFLKTTDAGTSWQVIDMNSYAAMLTDCYFWSRSHGIVIGGTTTDFTTSLMIVLETTNGGTSWKPTYTGPRQGEWGWKISFPTPTLGYCSIQSLVPRSGTGTDDFFLKTTNGGASWSRKKFWDTIYSAQGIGFVSTTVGWMGSYLPDNPTLVTTDGGETWRSTGMTGTINRFRFLSPSIGYASGSTVFRLQE